MRLHNRPMLCFMFLVLVLPYLRTSSGAIPLLPLIGGALVLGTSVYFGIKCRIDECCDNIWINCENATEVLSDSFKTKFYGQHLASNALLSVIDGYCLRSKIKSTSPWKAVTISLHGPTGTGKSYVSQLIAEALFKKGMKSAFVHYFDLQTDLRSDSDQALLHNWILGNASLCPHQIFIFSEIDKADVKFASVLDKLHKFLDYGASEMGVDLTNVIYIFTGNLGTPLLVDDVTERYRNGLRRHDIPDRELELLLERAAFDQQAGLFRSEIVRRKLIDAFVPFLPMEKHHVEQCIRAELEARLQVQTEDGGFKMIKVLTPEEEEKFISSITDELEFEPNGEHSNEQFFAVTGCKEVQRLVQKATYEFFNDN